ncbi:anthranilate synthase family protein [Streptomyces tubbatahanensis]|uniref:anthranilate synthase n=1 Tax=Streptomyces tubbatahanensis TaxID=2923272 RepID=A0ABY3XQB0_9ACTN|nr:anthranilate synthase family protein [Streptomyces tubbatahanensis]UNS96580.1 anthranilate synthase family protein [Streptomyces tubbatahanensis]
MDRTTTPSPAALVERLTRPDAPPFALLRRRTPGREADVVEVLTGTVREVERLADIPVRPGGEAGALALVPFRQIRERGFDVRDDGTPLSVLLPDERYTLPYDDVLAALPGHHVAVEPGAFDVDDDAYEQSVRRVVGQEIGSGEGANFVIRRDYEARVPGFTRADALALFARLLRGEQGAYWTFVVHTGTGTPPAPAERSGVRGRGRGRVLVGASPEVHVRMRGGTVVMNPISGTYRYPAQGPDAAGLLEFLADRKESEELSMVVDEELKMMCTVGDEGGVVVGPRLKEMAHLAHTEYELRGRSTLDVREVLRETMFAATVTGSPVQNACRVIERHESTGRGYYAGALALIGHDAAGAQTLDSPILIRTADIDARTGALRVPVGATLVRASQPASEVAETHAKAAAVLTALGVRDAPAHAARRPRARLADDPRVQAALEGRRAGLAPFWLRMRTGRAGHGNAAAATAIGAAPGAGATGDTPAASEEGRTRDVLVVDGEDTFTSMLAHLLRSTGCAVRVRRFDAPGLHAAALAHAGPVVLGPGPGDPRNAADPKMRLLRGLAADLVAGARQPLLGVCLGHELLAAELGLDLVRKQRPHQGAQETVDLFGRPETVGFYNSYTARCDEETATELALHGIELSRDPASGEIHALRGPGFAGVQFHPESVLTLDGVTVVAQLLAAVSEGAGKGKRVRLGG